MTAYNISMTYAKDRFLEVVPIVGARLMQIGRFESAGEVYESAGYYDKAVDAYCKDGKFDRATSCASQIRQPEIQNLMFDQIQHLKKTMYAEKGKIDRIVQGGDISGLDIYEKRGQWEELLNLAEKQGPNILNEYLMRFSRVYLKNLKFQETANILTRYGCPVFKEILAVYKTIAVKVLPAVHDGEL